MRADGRLRQDMGGIGLIYIDQFMFVYYHIDAWP